MQPRNYTFKLLVWFWDYSTSICHVHGITSLYSWVVSIADCRCEVCRFKSPHKFSCDSWMVACTVVCCSIKNIKWPAAEWSKLSFSSPELQPMLHGCRFKSCWWLYSVYTNKKLSHPSSLSCVLAVAPTMKRSAVQPKTTRLCSSIIVISLWAQYTHTPTQ